MSEQQEQQKTDDVKPAQANVIPPKLAEPAAPETDWKAEARKWEDRAKENAEARKRLDEIEAANKTEIEKAAEARTKAEQERDAARAEALRFRVAAAHGISTAPAADGGPSDAELFLTASDEATLTKQAERLLGRDAERKRTGNVAPREGTNPPAGGDQEAASFMRQLLGPGD